DFELRRGCRQPQGSDDGKCALDELATTLVSVKPHSGKSSSSKWWHETFFHQLAVSRQKWIRRREHHRPSNHSNNRLASPPRSFHSGSQRALLRGNWQLLDFERE